MDIQQFKNLKKGDLVRLTTTIDKSKHFKKGVVLVLLKDYACFQGGTGITGSFGEVKTLSGVHFTNYYSEICPNCIELVTQEEVIEMNKPSKHVTNIVGTTEFVKHGSEAAREAYLQKTLTANPVAEIAVYTLTGVAAAVPVEVKFTTIRDLSAIG